MVLYFRWRTATMGTEIYWHGINDYRNRPNRRVAEAAQIGREIEVLGSRVVTTQTARHVAIVRDYDNEWDGELDLWHGPYTRQSIQAWFVALQYQHIPVDTVYLRSATTLYDLARYRVLVYPHRLDHDRRRRGVALGVCSSGGTVIFGARNGYKDTTGQCYMRPFPGPVADLCGITVADFTRIGPDERAPALRWGGMEGVTIAAKMFNDILQVEAPDVEVLAEYADAYYAGAPAFVRRAMGNGRAYYYGAVFNVEAATALIKQCGLSSPVGDWLDLPQPVELCIRESADRNEELIFLLNYSDEPQTITLHKTAMNIVSGQQVQGAVVLAPFDVRVLSATDAISVATG